MITYNITDARWHVNPDGSAGQIHTLIWSASETVNGTEGAIHDRGTVIPVDYLPAQKPANTVTEAEAVGWITDLEEPLCIRVQIRAIIAEKDHPTQAHGFPWLLP